MRVTICALALTFTTPALAQERDAELTRASEALSAIWRPLTGPLSGSAMQAACTGAIEEMAAVEASLPPVLSPGSLRNVRALRGLLIVPDGEDPGLAYFFPPRSMDWFTPGLGAIRVISEAEGFIAVRDASGRDIAFQLGRAGGRVILRIRPPEGDPLTYVACAPTG